MSPKLSPSIERLLTDLATNPNAYIQESFFGVGKTAKVIGGKDEKDTTNISTLHSMANFGLVELEDPNGSPRKYWITSKGIEAVRG